MPMRIFTIFGIAACDACWAETVVFEEHFLNKTLQEESKQIREKYVKLYKDKVGVFEGAGYTPKGLYRSEVQIGMFRDSSYGPVSEEAIGDVIKFLSQ